MFKETEARVPTGHLRRLFDMVASAEVPGERGEVNLVFTTDAGMRRLNRQYRGLDRTTDVLSFNLNESDGDEGTYGEVYISIPQADRQAEEYGHGRYGELLRLACHGFLHLFGYDHEESDQQRRMQEREEYYLTRSNKARKK